MALFGRNITLDPRRLNGFVRDISVLSEDEYAQLAKPSKLKKFPDDLFNSPGLQYSGIYEDGWVSSRSIFSLAAANPGDVLVVKGMFPALPGCDSNDLLAWVNDQPPQRMHLLPGEFTVTLPVQTAGTETKLHLEFQRSVALPSPDDRPVAALLQSIRIGPPGASSNSGM